MRPPALLLGLALLPAPLFAGAAPVSIRLDPARAGAEIPASFSGLSYEVAQTMPGPDGEHYFRPDNTRLIALFHTLGIRSLRIGGNTSDRNLRKLPDRADLDDLFAFARAAHVKVIYCLRLFHGDANEDAATAKYLMDRYGELIDTFSIGQEPSAYPVGRVDPRPANERMGAAHEHYPYARYRDQWRQFARAIIAAVPDVRFCGPSVHNNALWTREFITDFAQGYHVALITDHLYPGGAAGKLPSAAVGRDRMLSGALTAVCQKLYDGFVPEARAAELPYRLEEVNSYFNGGARDASDTFAEALWGLDFMHWWAAHGAAGLNFHTGDRVSMNGASQAPHYAAFQSEPGGFRIRPLAYGLKAFQFGGRGRVVPVSLVNREAVNLTAYAVLASDGTLRVTLINREHGADARTAVANLAPGPGWATADAIDLTAPGGDVAAKAGLLFGGAPIAEDGSWKGSWHALPPPEADGTLSLHVPPATAIIVRLRRAAPQAAATTASVTVDFAKAAGPLPDFWNSSGQDQNYLQPLFELNAENIGSVPHGGCTWLRLHDLLKLVTVQGLGSDHPVYDWSRLDRTLDTERRAGLKPFFELMGNPSGFFTSFGDRRQLREWKRFIADLARHLEARYGRAEVRGWYFESWNEPNLVAGRGGLWHSPTEFEHYYDASSEGLKAADPRLRFGGPAVSRVDLPWGNYLSSFFEHCDSGTNALTGEKGVRLDFITFHRKNTPQAMVEVETEAIDRILALHPRFADLAIINDEADSEVGWAKRLVYHATPWYAAFIARSVNEHLLRIFDGGGIAGGRPVRYRLSNDDAFWGTWENRTQFALFRSEGRFAQVNKPSHEARTALALLGDERRAVTGLDLEGPYGAIATVRGEDQAAVLLYHYSDLTDATGPGEATLHLEHLPFSSGRLAIYRIDSHHGDTFRLWRSMGSPAVPTDAQLVQLRAAGELAATDVEPFQGGSLTRELALPLPGVAVVVLSADTADAGDTITGVHLDTFRSLSGQASDVMIRWTSRSWFVRTFEVLHADAPAGPWSRLSPGDQIETGFVWDTPKPGGYIKIRALDYWNRDAGESAAIPVAPS